LSESTAKSAIIALQDAGWLVVVIVIFAATIAASSLVCHSFFSRFRHFAAR
jgi:hypothetical protein